MKKKSCRHYNYCYKKKKVLKKKKTVSFVREDKENSRVSENVMKTADDVAEKIARTENVVSVRNITDKVIQNYTSNTKKHNQSKNRILSKFFNIHFFASLMNPRAGFYLDY